MCICAVHVRACVPVLMQTYTHACKITELWFVQETAITEVNTNMKHTGFDHCQLIVLRDDRSLDLSWLLNLFKNDFFFQTYTIKINHTWVICYVVWEGTQLVRMDTIYKTEYVIWKAIATREPSHYPLLPIFASYISLFSPLLGVVQMPMNTWALLLPPWLSQLTSSHCWAQNS